MLCFQGLGFVDNATQQLLIDGVSGQIHPRDFILLTGQSGSGKSLLLQLLASLLRPSYGKLTWQGQTLQAVTPAHWRAQIAYVAQAGEMIDGTVLDNLRLPLTFGWYRNRKFDLDWQVAQLTQLGKTTDFLQKDSQHLSGGEKLVVNLLRTLQLRPKVLLLDEPTAALDDALTHQVEALVHHWHQAQSDAGIVWISHKPTQIQRLQGLASQHWHMQQGHWHIDAMPAHVDDAKGQL